MTKFLLGVLLLVCSVADAATTAPITQFRYVSSRTANTYGPWVSSQEAACASNNTTFYPPNSCADGGIVYGTTEVRSWCSNDTAPVNGVCTVPDPTPTCTAGKQYEIEFQRGTKAQRSTAPLPTGAAGCAFTVDEVVHCYSDASINQPMEPVYCRYSVTETGESISGGDTPATGQPVNKDPELTENISPGTGQGCPKGTVRIGTDSAGGAICAGSGTSGLPKNPPPVTTKPPVTTNNADGSTTKVEVTERLNGDGSKTTTTKTTVTAADGTQTVSESTSTGQTPAGGTGKADPIKEEQSDFCKQNPTLTVCRNSTISGACAQTSCEGDAITCEIARKAREAACKQQESEDAIKGSAQYDLGNKILGGNDPSNGTLPTPDNGQTVNMNQQLNQNGFYGSAQCFANMEFKVLDAYVPVDLTAVCEHVLPLRALVMIAAGLASLMIIYGTILRK